MRKILTLALLAGSACAAMAQQTAAAGSCALPKMSSMESRLYQKAAEGTNELRQFMHIRRGILQMDVMETALWAERLDNARAACVQRASAEPAGTQVVLLPAQ